MVDDMSNDPSSFSARQKAPGVGTAKSMPAEVATYFRSLFAGRELVLDVGCGQGDFLWDKAVGVDLDTRALRSAGHRRVAADLDLPLPFKSRTFDGVLAKDVIEHLRQPRGLMTELQRVTKQDGRLVIVTPRAVPRVVWGDYTHLRGFTRRAIESLLQDSGWHMVDITRFGAVPFVGRLRLVHLIPILLRVPGLGHYLGTNWLVIARKR